MEAKINFDSPDWALQVSDYWKKLQIREPTTAYDILNRVIELAEEEPRRLNMGTWGSKIHPSLYAEGANSSRIPECGTVACFAGWAEIVTLGQLVTDGVSMSYLLTGSRQLCSGVFINGAVTDYKNSSPRVHTAHAIGYLKCWIEFHKALLLGRTIDSKTLLVNGRREPYIHYYHLVDTPSPVAIPTEDTQ